jgi:hypothetical protein
VPRQAPLDGISLLPLINGALEQRPASIGFWDYTAKGIGTPSAEWMGALLKAQQAGSDLPPHESSQRAAALPDPPLPTTTFPGHAALIEEAWKLHRIEGKDGKLMWELYDLATDPAEANDVAQSRADVVSDLKPKLISWLSSVVQSLNGQDY